MFPKHNFIHCEGFPRALLSSIIFAIKNTNVKWENGSIIMSDRVIGRFAWYGCVWELEEISDIVCRIQLIRGSLDSEDLTAAVLKAKIESS